MGNCQSEEMAHQIAVPSGFQGIIIAANTWKGTYSNLFDYTSATHQNYVRSSANVSIKAPATATYINKEGDKIIQADSQDPSSIIKLQQQKGNWFILTPCDNPARLTAQQLWLVVKSTPSKKYHLKEGDLIKVGKQKIKVKEIVLEDNALEDNNLEIQTKYKIYQQFLTKEKSAGYNDSKDPSDPSICRVCLDEGQLNNPLIAPCKCSGSAKFIHIKCIQEWFNKTINPRTVNSSVIITWKPLVCQLCAESLPFKVYFDGNKHFTVNIPRPKKPYIVLNPMDSSNKNTKIKTYYLISFCQKNLLSLGRKKQCDIVMGDESTISRHHSTIQYIKSKNPSGKSKFIISDNDSKFGTAILLKKPIKLDTKPESLSFQCGGTVLSLGFGKSNKTTNINEQMDDFNVSNDGSSSESPVEQ